MFAYTSRDAYNGCLTLYPDREAFARGFIRLNLKKIIPVETTIENATASKPRLPQLQNVGELMPNNEVSAEIVDYIPPFKFQITKIILTDVDHFQKLQAALVKDCYSARLHIHNENHDLSDMKLWPSLSLTYKFERMTLSDGTNLSVSIDDGWSICEISDDEGTVEKWEIISVEEGKEVPAVKVDTYCDVAKRNMDLVDHSTKPNPHKRKAKSEWKPQIIVLTDAPTNGIYEINIENINYENESWDFFYDDYEFYKSAGVQARTSTSLANVDYSRKKNLGVITHPVRSVK